jgi:hypothetical protein
MKRWGFPLWLLRDVPALLGVLPSFWSLVIFAMTRDGKALHNLKPDTSVLAPVALLLAHAEARLGFALWRQAYRRLSWNPRGVALNIIAPTTGMVEAAQRLLAYTRAFLNMNAVVDAYVDHLRERYRIRELVSDGSTDARQSRAAHRERVCVTPFQRSPLALIFSSARSARPSKEERDHTHARSPPPHHTQNQEPATSHVNARDRIAMPKAC